MDENGRWVGCDNCKNKASLITTTGLNKTIACGRCKIILYKNGKIFDVV
jgi:hypothetical protein